MSEAENFDIKNDENDDIYKDIGDFHFDRELAKLEECNKAYSEDIEKLTVKIKQLTERNTELQSVNDILTTNISILLKTAKVEIQRKQLVIDEFRKKIEDTNKRNCFKEDVLKNQGVCKICGSRFSRDNVNDLQDVEIMKNNSDEVDIRSEMGSHRNFKSKDKREYSDNHKKKDHKESHESSRGRSSDKYSSHSHRSSRRSDDSRFHHSTSSRKRSRYKSPDERRHFSKRKRSRERTNHSSDYVWKSSSQKREHIPREKEITRRSEERQRSHHSKVPDSCNKVNSPAPKSSTKSEKNSGNTESSSRPASASESKSNVFRSDANVIKNKTEEEGNGKTEIQKNVKTDSVKKLNKDDYHERKNGNCNGDSDAVKKCENNLFTRQSVLADLYDDTIFRSKFPDTQKPNNPQTVSEYDNGAANCIDSSSDESWTLSFGKKTQVLNKPKTLYSRRMEIRLKQKLKEDEMNVEDKCGENNCPNQEKYLEGKPICTEEEKEEGEISFEEDKEEQVAEDIVQKEEVSENTEEAPTTDENNQLQDKLFADKTCPDVDVETEKPEPTASDKDYEQSFGENIIQNSLQLRKQEEISGIKEFSPLKNNYKLSKISPLKSIEKQHILEYYNLKPAQLLNNIEPEILDFSFSVPETPGKNFSNPFSALDSQEPTRDNEDDKLKTFEEGKCITKLISDKDAEGNNGNKLNSVEVEETNEGPKFEKDEKGASPEGKKLGRTRAKRKLRPNAAKEQQTDSTQVTPKNKKNKDPVTYQIRTRSRTGNETRKCTREVNDLGEKRGRAVNKNKSAPTKRKRNVVSSEEEAEEEQEQKHARKKANNGPEIEISESNNEETVEKEIENEKELNETKTEDASKANDVTYFEVFQSTSEATNDMTVEEKNPLEELSLSNVSDCRATNTSRSDAPDKLKSSNESKLSLLSAGNSGDSSTFKVLRSYLMLSVNEESDVEAFSEDSSCSSGEYSDSGASAFVDLL